MPGKSTDDALTLIALGVLAFVVADVTHEAVGHGLAILVVGAKPVILTASYFASSGKTSRWISAAGGTANVLVSFLSLLALHLQRGAGPHFRYFLTLTIAFNLLFATAYPAYSGIAGFGDWAAVVSGLSPRWLWRVLLVVSSGIFYYLSLRLIAVEIRPFCGSGNPEALGRLRRITLIPYVAALAIASFAGLLNPAGWGNIFTAALPAAAAAFGLTQMDHFLAARVRNSSVPLAGTITRSLGWITAAALVAVFFVWVLGPGIQFDPGR